jgi:hypothetical protein
MKRLLAISLLAGALLLVSANAYADSVDFVALPTAITGAPGSTEGWGYSITNNTSQFLVATSLNAGVFQGGTIDLFTLFDYPIVAPGSTAAQVYDPNLFTGLAQFTWDANVASGTTNTGFFDIGFDYFDPTTGGDLGPAFDAQAPYSVTAVAPVPEPASIVLLAFGLVAALLLVGRKL